MVAFLLPLMKMIRENLQETFAIILTTCCNLHTQWKVYMSSCLTQDFCHIPSLDWEWRLASIGFSFPSIHNSSGSWLYFLAGSVHASILPVILLTGWHLNMIEKAFSICLSNVLLPSTFAADGCVISPMSISSFPNLQLLLPWKLFS